MFLVNVKIGRQHLYNIVYSVIRRHVVIIQHRVKQKRGIKIYIIIIIIVLGIIIIL